MISPSDLMLLMIVFGLGVPLGYKIISVIKYNRKYDREHPTLDDIVGGK